MIKVDALKQPHSMARYFAEESASMRWQGHVAFALGIHGQPVTQRGLLAAASGRSPRDGQPLYQRLSSRRRLGWGLIFAPDKSVSVAALVGAYGDRIVHAHARAVEIAFEWLAQPAAAVRARASDGSPRWRTTGTMLYTVALHRTNREGEPHLHSHVLVLNVTQGQAQAWMALQIGLLFQRLPALERAYQQELHARLRREGIAAERSPSGKTILPALQTEALRRVFAKAHARVIRQAPPIAEQIQRDRLRDGLPPLRPAVLFPLARQIANDRHHPPKDPEAERRTTRLHWRRFLDQATRDLIDRASKPSRRRRHQARGDGFGQAVTATGNPAPKRAEPISEGRRRPVAPALRPARQRTPSRGCRHAALALAGLRYLDAPEPTPKVQGFSPALAKALQQRLSPAARRVGQAVALDRAFAAHRGRVLPSPTLTLHAALRRHFRQPAPLHAQRP